MIARTGLLVVSLAMESVAAGILLVGTPHPRFGLALIAAASHAMASLLLAAVPKVAPSRRLLCVAAVLAVPLAGVGVAAVVLGTTGRGLAERLRRRARAPSAVSSDMTFRLADALPAVDGLVSGDDEERRTAIAALVRRADAEATAILRWAAASPDPDLALSAALALDEIGERAERHSVRRGAAAEVRHATA
jgi:hypothetical protein